ncbi:hypothetical protein QYM36_009443 [Artemia franciscana]|uniref:Endonuclease/exonuclease/phosphatase domain-containing protein n=1 Tax=Artemia franciscana TaxID=6661 RepID=A0AA88L5E5_ARTSF|nr:hypothetical protein QYM36_009443 [Artemia franciscana]
MARKSIESFMLKSRLCLATPRGLPTRLNPNTGKFTTINLAFADPSLFNKCTAYAPDQDVLISDHQSILIHLND